jgi:TDG/mug DNA glycosylase family protein
MTTGPRPRPPSAHPDPDTVAVYEQRAAEWRGERRPTRIDEAAAFGARVDRQEDSGDGRRAAPVIDLGCGPGWYAPALGETVIALDVARAMLDLAGTEAPRAWRVQADLAALPFRRGALAGAWASKSYVHLPQSAVPLALADLHRSLRVGAPLDLHVFAGDMEHDAFPDDTFPGRRFSAWPIERLVDVVVGAGFTIDDLDTPDESAASDRIVVSATRARTLPDTVGPDMRILVCGLNPSVYSADVGIGFGRPGNRFWTAAVAAGLATVDRDPHHALLAHGMGMTDLVKRATPRADALTRDEYRSGLDRVTRLVDWLRPGAVCFVGLAGWRAAVDRRAIAGEQPDGLAGVPVYVMPSTSGLNARTTPAELEAHLRAAAVLADSVNR